MEKDSVFSMPEDFFDRDEVIRIESLQGGKDFLLILIRLYCKFSNKGGKIGDGDQENSGLQTLALISKTARIDILTARKSMELFLETGFMYEKDGNLYLQEILPYSERERGGETGMANRRMFSLDVVDTDAFIDMPVTAQALYFHLGMRADDDGFISSPKKITKMVNCSLDDMNILIEAGYLIPFDSGVVVVRDWKVNNYIQKDRYTPTRNQDEKKKLSERNRVYIVIESEIEE